MIDNYEPREGDRVLVTYEGTPDGGCSGTVVRKGWSGTRWVHFDLAGMDSRPFADVTVLQLLHRPAPPRPVVESFTRSDGVRVKWEKDYGLPTIQIARSFEDAEAFARMYSQAADQMRWDAEYGDKP